MLALKVANLSYADYHFHLIQTLRQFLLNDDKHSTGNEAVLVQFMQELKNFHTSRCTEKCYVHRRSFTFTINFNMIG